MNRRFARVVWTLAASILVFPAAVFAQASIAGVVRDASQAVLPGVTVEAASPALIEKVRTVVTDGAGLFTIADLRPGTYAVTFTLPGFATIKREGVELTGSATVQVNADMRVGALEETITVSGETPLVDVRNARTQAVLDSDAVANLPSTRNYRAIETLVVGVETAASNQNVGGTRTSTGAFAGHGGSSRDSDIQVGGMSIQDSTNGGGSGMYIPSAGESAEITLTSSGGLGEARRAGTVINLVPREGGNTFAGNLYLQGATGGMQQNNITDELVARGFRAPGTLRKVFDYEGIFGGPIMRDKLWFLAKLRYNGFDNWVPGLFQNLNAGDPNKWTYEPDLSKPSSTTKFWLGASTRLTWQASARNKFSVYYEDQETCDNCGDLRGGNATTSPEALGRSYSHPDGLGQILWTSPVTTRLLLEAGFTYHPLRWGVVVPAEGVPDVRNFIRVQEQGGLIPGLNYRALPDTQSNFIGNHVWRAAASYITGSHSMKFGWDGGFFKLTQEFDTDRRLTYRLNNGVPNQVTLQAYPLKFEQRMHEFGLYAQDQWTYKRFTLAGGVRYDNFRSKFPGFTVGPSTYLTTASVFQDVDLADLNDITTRWSAAYDVFGDGRTAVKLMIGKYTLSQSTANSDLGGLSAVGNRISQTTNIAWNDSTFPVGDPRRGNFVPDCNLLNPALNGECGPWSDPNFGKAVLNTRIDPAAARGWGVRPYNWSMEAGIQRELTTGLSTSVTYFRRSFGNQLVTDNQALTLADYTFFNLPLPNDPRLPINGTVNGFYNVVPSKFGVTDNLVTSSNNYGGITQNWNGVDVLFNARIRGLTTQGGFAIGKAFKDACTVAAKTPTFLNTLYESGGPLRDQRAVPMGYCKVDQALQKQFKALAAYTVPKIDVQLAGNLQAIPGRERTATYNAPNAVVAPLLGRSISGGQANIPLNLLPPAQIYDGRITLLDARVGKILRFGKRKAQISFDVFNVLNVSSILSSNDTYSPTGTWEIPAAIAGGRLLKLTAQLDF